MLAGVLSRLGCATAATLMPANFANERGYYESAPIAELNDHILLAAGSIWSDWRPFNTDWFTSEEAADFHKQAKTLMTQEFGRARMHVMKDPRLCRIMPFWRGVFDARNIDPVALHIHRNPLEVAKSLNRRDGMDPNYALLLWLRYTLDAEMQTRDLPRHFTSYTAVMADWATEVAAAGKALDLNWPRISKKIATEVAAFISPDMVHCQEDRDRVLQDPLLSDWTRNTYAIFERWAVQGEDPTDRVQLDEIRTQLDKSALAFAGALETGNQAARDMVRVQSELEKATRQIVDLKDAVLAETRAVQRPTEDAADLTQERETARRDLDTQRTALNTAQHHLAALVGDLERRDTDLLQRQAEVDELTTQMGAREAELAQKISEVAQRQAEADHWAERVALLEQQLERQQAESEHWMARASVMHEQIEELTLTQKTAEHEQEQNIALLEQRLVRAQEAANKEATRLRSRMDQGLAQLRERQIAQMQAKTADFEAAQYRSAAQQAQLRSALEAVRKQMEALHYDNEQMLSSSSWRLTAPLRKLKALFRS